MKGLKYADGTRSKRSTGVSVGPDRARVTGFGGSEISNVNTRIGDVHPLGRSYSDRMLEALRTRTGINDQCDNIESDRWLRREKERAG